MPYLHKQNACITLNPQEAKDYGLVHEIKSDLFPAGADLSVVGEQPQQIQIPLPHGLIAPGPVQHMTVSEVKGFTVSTSLRHGTYFDNVS